MQARKPYPHRCRLRFLTSLAAGVVVATDHVCPPGQGRRRRRRILPIAHVQAADGRRADRRDGERASRSIGCRRLTVAVSRSAELAKMGAGKSNSRRSELSARGHPCYPPVLIWGTGMAGT